MLGCFNSHFCFQPQATRHVKSAIHTTDAYKFHKSSHNSHVIITTLRGIKEKKRTEVVVLQSSATQK